MSISYPDFAAAHSIPKSKNQKLLSLLEALQMEYPRKTQTKKEYIMNKTTL
ncbi:hypothetical protein [Nitrosomonas sp. sh817]|jgi:hypothetical protein|uniref:hypothetical protein n=1 Tax=unclassified Nitrosomonas TaxID=2609265 RepID=UPI0027DBA52E|nr:hypothetical protein [Nitrosomonas sp. sh817]WMJ07490.1 hypothetical protein RBH92_08560 [Nitrosomonas sp. sh817]